MTTTPQQLIVYLFIASSILMLITLISVGILIWFRKAVGDRIKLKKMMFRGYVIAELIRFDRTRIRRVLIPTENTIKFPGIEGNYILDNASVTLTDRKYPTYTWNEGDVAPINFGKEHVETLIKCPHCSKDTIVKIDKPKSIAPSVLDNIILKIKTLAQLAGLNKTLMMILILIVGAIIVGGICTFFVIDFRRRIGEILAPTILQQCRQAIIEGGKAITA